MTLALQPARWPAARRPSRRPPACSSTPPGSAPARSATVVTRSDPVSQDRLGLADLRACGDGRAGRRPQSTSKPISDLPISVGIRASPASGCTLNAVAGLPYFASHLPGVAAGGTLSWVYTTAGGWPPARDRSRSSGRRRGRCRRSSAPCRRSPPGCWRAVRPRTRSADLRLVAFSNLSSVPQYQLQVYAYARGRHRYLAAGSTSIVSLNGDSSTTVQLRLTGPPDRGAVQVQASATIYD